MQLPSFSHNLPLLGCFCGTFRPSSHHIRGNTINAKLANTAAGANSPRSLSPTTSGDHDAGHGSAGHPDSAACHRMALSRRQVAGRAMESP